MTRTSPHLRLIRLERWLQRLNLPERLIITLIVGGIMWVGTLAFLSQLGLI